MTAAEAEAWRARFLSQGGSEHIYGILMSGGAGDQGILSTSAGQQSVALLLKIIRKFLIYYKQTVSTWVC